MVPFVMGVLSGMAIQKTLGGKEDEPVFKPVEMREVTEEHVKDTLAKASRTLQSDEGFKAMPAREVSNEELPDYIRKKLAARGNSAVADE